VTLFDNNAPSMTVHPDQVWWGFGPDKIVAGGGEPVVFINPPTNQHGHTVTSLERIGSPFDNRVNVGTLFDSSPTADRVLQPGQSFTVDTSQLPNGNYPYFCKLHPWAVGELTVINSPATTAPSRGPVRR
jgi:plastocyanin